MKIDIGFPTTNGEMMFIEGPYDDGSYILEVSSNTCACGVIYLSKEQLLAMGNFIVGAGNEGSLG